MKVYSCPEAIPAPSIDYFNFDSRKAQASEEAHQKALKAHLVEMGYRGKHTGKVASFPAADGYAQYMMADGKGRYGPSCLFHLPYGDAYQYRGIQHMTKAGIIEEIERGERRAALFANRGDAS